MGMPILILGLMFGPVILAIIGYWVEREQNRRDFLAGQPTPTTQEQSP